MPSAASTELSNRPRESGGTLRGFVFGLFLLPWTACLGSLTVISGLVRLPRGCSFSIFTWARGLMRVAGLNVHVSGLEKLQNGKPYVFLANHQSALDIPILYKACVGRHDIRFMAKESLFKIPFMGILQELKDRVAKLPYSYIVFPEGTRSPDGRLQPLKKGSIGLALRLGLPVVPVTIVDACRANPKASFKIRGGTVHVIFHEPISAPDIDNEGRGARDETTAQVYDAILSALPGDQKPAATRIDDSILTQEKSSKAEF
jgi:1-acyl-sn-glycerol-3-phosphate acyltransferase